MTRIVCSTTLAVVAVALFSRYWANPQDGIALLLAFVLAVASGAVYVFGPR